MLKVYGIYGHTTALINFPAGKGGKAFLRCEFTKGRMGGLASRPATYTTSDPIKQSIIESSPLFGKSVKLVRFHQTEEDLAAEKEDAGKSSSLTITPVPEVTTLEEAIKYLKANGAKATELTSVEKIKKYIAKKGITFPNFNI